MTNLHYSCMNSTKEATYFCHNGQSVIDLIFTGQNVIVDNDPEVKRSDITKHAQVITTLYLSYNKRPKRKMPIRKIDICKFEIHLKDLHSKQFESTPSEVIEKFMEILETCALYPKSRKSKPWFDKKLYHCHRNLKYLRQTNDPKYHEAKKAYKSEVRKTKHQYETLREQRIVNEAESDPKRFWSILRSRKKQTIENHISLSEWEEHFKNLFGHTNRTKLMPRIDATECTDDILMQYLSPLEIYNQIHKQPNKKAAGPDGITYEVLKQILDSALFLIHDLFNYYFDQGDFPETWKNGYIIPLYKGKGPKKDAKSYRGIALLSCMYKIFTGVIQNRLYCWTEEKHFLPDSQFGFRRGLSTLDAAESLIKEIKRHVDSIGRAYVCFVDFAKAFDSDSINRDLLLQKLYFYGVKGRVFNTICSLLEKTTRQWLWKTA